MTNRATISIGRLGVRMPGTDARAGERVAARVTASLGARLAELPAGISGRVGQLSVRAEPRDSSEAAVSEAIVESVIRALSRHRRER
jgi:hypothetical protein